MMRTALITYLDDNFIKNLKEDFMSTLRGSAFYKGPVYIIYYGRNKVLADQLERQLPGIKFIFRKKKFSASNQRNIDIVDVIGELPKEIDHVMCVDADVWFQAPIDEAFSLAEGGYGFVEEDLPADKLFNLQCINAIKNDRLRKLFLREAKNRSLINSGMIVGERNKIREIIKEVAELTEIIKQDFFAADQAIFNYVVRKDGTGKVLPRKYNYSLHTSINRLRRENWIFFDNKEGLVSVVHNSGSVGRFFPNGRQSIKNVPTIPKKLKGSFWGIVTFFNPAGYRNKVENYRVFRKSNKKQGLKLLAIECAFGEKPFELSEDDADILIQVRTGSVMWQKERLLNIGLENLPKDCDKFAWLDADIIFLNDNWVKETMDLLDDYAVVQPFRYAIRMKKGASYIDESSVGMSKKMDEEGVKSEGFASRISQVGLGALRYEYLHGHPGFAWAARREIFAENGFFDKNIYFISSDLLMAYAFYHVKKHVNINYYLGRFLKDSFFDWAKDIHKKVGKSVYFTNGTILHLWHGGLSNREFDFIRVLNAANFDPDNDIRKAESGCWEWATDKPVLRSNLANYFLMRNEEDSLAVKILSLVRNPLFQFYKLQHFFYLKFDQFLGLIGMFLKKFLPNVYPKVKRIEVSIRSILQR